MKRRDFLKNTGAIASTPLLLNGIPVSGMNNSFLSSATTGFEDRVLVVIQLFGGNDVFNTFVPLNQTSEYYAARPTIGIQQSRLTELDPTLNADQEIGLHPALGAKFKSLYDDGLVRIVNGVGYPNPNRSHFGSDDNMMAGDDGNHGLVQTHTGWVGRTLKALFPNVNGLPTSNMQDPPAIQLGNLKPVTTFLNGTEFTNALSIGTSDPTEIANLAGEFGNNVPSELFSNTDWVHVSYN